MNYMKPTFLIIGTQKWGTSNDKKTQENIKW